MFFELIDMVMHIDVYLTSIVQSYPFLTYALLFSVIFLETGLVVLPFLPGDSLLFAVGALAATGSLHVGIVFLLIFAAAVLGDTANYHIGKFIGPKIFRKENSVLFHKEHLVRSQAFYEKHGAKTIVLARFIPIIRTFAPFLAGIGKMSYPLFLGYNILGGLLWSSLFIFGGYFFGNLSIVQENFSLVIILIIVLSCIPLVKEVLTHFFAKKKVPPSAA